MKYKLLLLIGLVSLMVVVAGCGVQPGKSVVTDDDTDVDTELQSNFAGQASGRLPIDSYKSRGATQSAEISSELKQEALRNKRDSGTVVSDDETNNVAEICDNNKDDDNDGKIDCKDGECSSSTDCGPIELTECNSDYVWEEGATYRLMNDAKSKSTCFVINKNDVTLDCNGYTIKLVEKISPEIYYGILIKSKGVTVSNCGVDNYNIGISSDGVENLLEGNSISNSVYGIELLKPTFVKSNIIKSSNQGIFAGSSGSFLQNNYACGNYYNDFKCSENVLLSGKGNTFDKVEQCSNAWPQKPKNYNKCPKN